MAGMMARDAEATRTEAREQLQKAAAGVSHCLGCFFLVTPASRVYPSTWVACNKPSVWAPAPDTRTDLAYGRGRCAPIRCTR